MLEIPDDVRLSDGEVAELSADVTSPEGKTLEDVCCVVDLEVSGPAPRPSREEGASSADDDVSRPFRYFLQDGGLNRLANEEATSYVYVLRSRTSTEKQIQEISTTLKKRPC